MLTKSGDHSVGRWLEANLKAVDRKLTPWLVVGWHRYNPPSLSGSGFDADLRPSPRPWYNSNWVHQGEAEQMRVAMEGAVKLL